MRHTHLADFEDSASTLLPHFYLSSIFSPINHFFSFSVYFCIFIVLTFTDCESVGRNNFVLSFFFALQTLLCIPCNGGSRGAKISSFSCSFS